MAFCACAIASSFYTHERLEEEYGKKFGRRTHGLVFRHIVVMFVEISGQGVHRVCWLIGPHKRQGIYEHRPNSLLQVFSIHVRSSSTPSTSQVSLIVIDANTDLSRFKPDRSTMSKVRNARKKLLKSGKHGETVSLKPLFEILKGQLTYDQIKVALVFV